MKDIRAKLSDEDVEKINTMIAEGIEKAYHAGYEQGQKDERRNADLLKQLQELNERSARRHIPVYPYPYPYNPYPYRYTWSFPEVTCGDSSTVVGNGGAGGGAALSSSTISFKG